MLTREKVEEIIRVKSLAISKDQYYPRFHIAGQAGLINDPNGLCYFNGKYHIFFQWNPLGCEHKNKSWGHVTSSDLLSFENQPPALLPNEWYDKDGCYSGSAIVKEGQLWLFYTGNVKDERGERYTYQCLAISDNGVDFVKQGPLISEVPKGYTAHFRDPKVFHIDDCYYMVVGAQRKDLTGAAVLFSSSDALNWVFKAEVKTKYDKFGYMWECPDIFHLDGKDVMFFCPQGVEAQGMLYNNLYQSGYIMGKLNFENENFTHQEFRELDRGFDFYAPQTFEHDGQRIAIGWMGMPEDASLSDEKSEWKYMLTLPRCLSIINDELYQQPLAALGEKRNLQTIYECPAGGRTELEFCIGELVIDFGGTVNNQKFEIVICKSVILSYSGKEKIFYMAKTENKQTRMCNIFKLNNLRIFIDGSSIECFINEGKEIFSTLFFPLKENKLLEIENGCESALRVVYYKY